VARGGISGQVADIAVWAVPFGLVGARLYHVITDYQNYFGEGKHPVDALKVWHGGLGIWGAVAFGALGAWIGCRRNGIKMPAMADSLAPGVVLAQAMGRWGNWFNQELFGRPTSLPWGLEIDVTHRPGLDPGVWTRQSRFRAGGSETIHAWHARPTARSSAATRWTCTPPRIGRR
jgi:prolipoprotein diacylglyceryltransferase